MASAVIHAPCENFETITMQSAAVVASAPTALKIIFGPRPGSLLVRQCATMPNWDIVNASNAPTANRHAHDRQPRDHGRGGQRARYHYPRVGHHGSHLRGHGGAGMHLVPIAVLRPVQWRIAASNRPNSALAVLREHVIS